MAYNFNNSNGFNNNFNSNSNNRRNEIMNRSDRYNDASLDTMNPAPRCPVVLLLDTSSSMSGAPIAELNAGVRQFIEETAADEAAGMSVELEVINFDDSAHVAMPFTPICDVDRNIDDLVADGMTSMGQALNLAYDHIKERRNLYKANGISSYKPWVVLMTDGGPNDSNWQQAAGKMRQWAEKGSLMYLGIEIGDDADHGTMCQILPAQPGPVKLKGLRFRQFFRWLTDSLKSVSASAVSDQNNVQLGSIRSWADLV